MDLAKSPFDLLAIHQSAVTVHVLGHSRSPAKFSAHSFVIEIARRPNPPSASQFFRVCTTRHYFSTPEVPQIPWRRCRDPSKLHHTLRLGELVEYREWGT